MIRLLMAQKRKKTKRFGEEGMNLLPCGEAHIQEVMGGGCGREREKSDRLAYESTHRRTLFNVSLTFLFSISDRHSLEERAERKSQEEGEREKTGGGNALPVLLKVTSPRQSQGSGFAGGPANQDVGESGRDRISLPDHPPHSFVCLFFSSSSLRRLSLARLTVTLPVDLDAQSLSARCDDLRPC